MNQDNRSWLKYVGTDDNDYTAVVYLTENTYTTYIGTLSYLQPSRCTTSLQLTQLRRRQAEIAPHYVKSVNVTRVQ